jgi:predicted cupin superfamily sugar epimerase
VTGTVASLIDALGLAPHPEGGWYAETWREDATTAIYFLLPAGEVSRWHRIDRTEIWHYYAGAALELRVAGAGAVVLGPDLGAGQRPQAVVPAAAWQTARSLGDYTLAGCTVSPAFEFAGFELAPEGWEPPT